jgi:hypothetical protein
MPLDGTGIWEPNLVVSKSETIQRINEDLKELKPLYNKNSEPATLYSFVDGRHFRIYSINNRAVL